MLETKIKCDGCGLDIEGRPGYPRNECLVLSLFNIPVPATDGTYAIYMKPKLDRDYHFHSIGCLSEWKKIAEYVK